MLVSKTVLSVRPCIKEAERGRGGGGGACDRFLGLAAIADAGLGSEK